MKKFLQNSIVCLLLLALIFVMCGNIFFTKGTLLLLDYIPTPHTNWSILWDFPYIFVQIPVTLFGVEFASKLIFFGILLVAAHVWVIFAKKIAEKISLKYSRILEFFWGAFLLLNPFAYERMMTQPLIYLGILLIGYVIYALFFLSGWKKWVIVGIISWVAINLVLHASFMIFLIVFLYGVFFVRNFRDFGAMIVAGMVAIFLNANRIFSVFFIEQNSFSTIQTFSLANFESFSTAAIVPMNVWLTNIFLYGFWGNKFNNHYETIASLSAFWYIAGAIIVAFSVWWWYIFFQKYSRRFVWFFVLIFGFSLVFGIGIASPLLQDVTMWMVKNIPLWAWYREPQKWIGLLVFVELIGFLLALWFFLKKFENDIFVKISASITIFLLFFIWSPGALFQFQGQLKTSVYPQEFEQIRSESLKTAQNEKILVFPWHSYIWCSWMGVPTISNPIAGLLFPLQTVVADNLEVGDLYSNSASERSQKIENFIQNHDFSTIQSLQISRILVMKQCANSKLYDFLEKIPECQKTNDNDFLSFYQCQK